MNILPFVVAFIAGLLIGVFYFGGLWLTIQKVYQLKRAWLWLFVSFISRLIVCLIPFYLLIRYNWLYLLPCLFGFLIVRFISVQIVKQNYDS
jgi:F1F0 ATPase subunit 2